MPRSKSNKHGRGASLGRSYPITPGLCLICGYYMDYAMNASGKGRPKKGDFTVCMNCGSVHKFDAKLGIVPASIDTARDELVPENFRRLMFTVSVIKARGPLPPKRKPS